MDVDDCGALFCTVLYRQWVHSEVWLDATVARVFPGAVWAGWALAGVGKDRGEEALLKRCTFAPWGAWKLGKRSEKRSKGCGWRLGLLGGPWGRLGVGQETIRWAWRVRDGRDGLRLGLG